jgi:hypothetical protein
MDKVELVTAAQDVPCHGPLDCLFQDFEDSKGNVLIIFAEILGTVPGWPEDPVGSSQTVCRPSRKKSSFCTESLQCSCKVVRVSKNFYGAMEFSKTDCWDPQDLNIDEQHFFNV